MPSSSPISDWVRFADEAQGEDLPGRAAAARRSAASGTPRTRCLPGRGPRSRCGRRARPRRRPPRAGRPASWRCTRCDAAMPSTTSSSGRPRRSASSARWGAVELLRQLVAGLGQVEPQLLQPPRHPHRPAGVTEEALDLADDRWHREGGELHPAAELEAVDRLDQADRADLDDVLHRLAAGAEAGGGELDQGEVELDEGVADVRVLVRALLQRLAAGRRASWTGRARRRVRSRRRGGCPGARRDPSKCSSAWFS